VFSAGADLKHVQSLVGESTADTQSPLGDYLRRARQVFDRIEGFPKPVIAAVHGLVIAGGLELVLCCDLVIAAESAKIGDGHSVNGFIPGGGGSVRLTRRLGPSRAKFLMFTGNV